MKSDPRKHAVDYAGTCVSALLALPTARKATKYLSPTFTVKATRQRKHDGRNKAETFLVTVGRPNYQEREFIAAAIEAKEPFPVKKVQLQYAPARA